MKRTIKNQLLLVLMIVATVVISAFAVSASTVTEAYCSKCQGTVAYTYGDIVEPQCESEGYTKLVCITHPDVQVGKANPVNALGHSLVTKEYALDELGTYYQHNEKCTRFGCQYGHQAGKEKPELDENGNEVRYCKVSFINDFVVDEFESKDFCPYADLAKTYKTEIEVKYEKFPTEADGKTVVSASKLPFRYPDKIFGEYSFIGWLSEEEITEVESQAASDVSAFSLRHDTSEILTANRVFDDVYNAFRYDTDDTDYYDSLVEEAEGQISKEITMLTSADLKLYAIFEVEMDYKHTVEFYNYDGTLLYKKTGVSHAIDNVSYPFDAPIRIPNVEYMYTFDHWNHMSSGKQVSIGNKIGAVYGDLKVIADFDYTLKQYNFRYCLIDGNNITPIQVNGSDAIDTVTIAGFGEDRLPAVTGKNIVVPTTFDAAYYYVHTGKWKIPSRGNYVVDLDQINLPQDPVVLSGSTFDLVPQYQQYLRMYKLVVKVFYTDDNNYHPKTIKLQVTNAEGKGVGYVELDQSEKYYEPTADGLGGLYTVEFDVAYSSYYKVTATSTGYVGTGSTQFREYDPEDPNDDTPGQVIVEMKQPEEDPCNCICHTVFKPVWVGILKLLNSMFKLEFVCCDDMFANIGSELNYGPGVSK